ncbi:hypothetical protein CCH79_00013235 [Gambusia affinis]|uniref:Yippee domain-containing protein n=1 Tax=Gambusia affinis TaxID=33528 RepID=A0A315V0N4_GAMAF|nr:hypothetical protein CCH79_00013235 [Gambusia affinis]
MLRCDICKALCECLEAQPAVTDPDQPQFSCSQKQARFSPVVSVWSVPHTHSTTTTAFACIFQCFFCQQVQQSCNSSSASPDTSEEPCPTDMVKMTKSKTFQAYLPSCHRTYSCIHCRAHLANHDELISKVVLLRSSSFTAHLKRYKMCKKNALRCGPPPAFGAVSGLLAVHIWIQIAPVFTSIKPKPKFVAVKPADGLELLWGCKVTSGTLVRLLGNGRNSGGVASSTTLFVVVHHLSRNVRKPVAPVALPELWDVDFLKTENQICRSRSEPRCETGEAVCQQSVKARSANVVLNRGDAGLTQFPHAAESLLCGNLDKVEEQVCAAVTGRKTYPGASSAGIPSLSSFMVNVGCGPAEERVLLTGLHAVADIYCENCKTTLGWKYKRSGRGRRELVYKEKQNEERGR